MDTINLMIYSCLVTIECTGRKITQYAGKQKKPIIFPSFLGNEMGRGLNFPYPSA